MFERADWSKRGEYMLRKHGVAPDVADDALGDANRGAEYGVNGWTANARDRRIYNAGRYLVEQGEADE